MCWLTADGVIPSACAAAFMLPCSNTAANTNSGFKSSIIQFPFTMTSENGDSRRFTARIQ